MKVGRGALTLLIAISAVAWALLLLSAGTEVPLTFFTPLGKVVTGIILLLKIFDKWLWRILPTKLVRRPKVFGTWRVNVHSKWQDPKTGAGIEPINAYLAVRQTFWTIDARLMTAESKSYQLSAQLVPPTPEVEDEYLLVAVYRNEPKLSVRDRSEIHFGALILRIPADSPKALTGQYWTDRLTCGELSGFSRDKRQFSSFADAEAYWISKTEPT